MRTFHVDGQTMDKQTDASSYVTWH